MSEKILRFARDHVYKDRVHDQITRNQLMSARKYGTIPPSERHLPKKPIPLPTPDQRTSHSEFNIGQIIIDNVTTLEKKYGTDVLPDYLIELKSYAQEVLAEDNN